MRTEIKIPAITNNDLKKVLHHYNLEGKLNEGKLNCVSCSQQITWENIGALLVKNKEIVLFCNLSECIEVASRGGNNA